MMRHFRRIIRALAVPATLCVVAVAAVPSQAELPGGATGADVTDRLAERAGWKTVAKWNGGKTKACRIDVDAVTSEVHVFWDGRNYPATKMQFTKNGSGGFGTVTAGFNVKGHTYSTADRGSVGPEIVGQFPTAGFIYFLAGSQVGICNERIVPVASVPTC